MLPMWNSILIPYFRRKKKYISISGGRCVGDGDGVAVAVIVSNYNRSMLKHIQHPYVYKYLRTSTHTLRDQKKNNNKEINK